MVQVSNRDGGVIAKGLLYEITLKGKSKANLVVLFYNTYYPNALNQIHWADISIPIKTLEDHQLNQEDYVNIKIDGSGAKLVF